MNFSISRNKKFFLLGLLLLIISPLYIASAAEHAPLAAEKDADTTEDNTQSKAKDDEEGNESALSRLKTRISFTKKEMGKISDPRIRDLYWYALNDTTDKKRYLRVHYAFNKMEDNWAFEFRGGVQGVAMNQIKEHFSLGPQFEVGFKKDLHPYWSARIETGWSHYEHELYTAHMTTMWKQGWTGFTGSDQWTPIEYSTVVLRGAIMLNVMNLVAGRELIYSPFTTYAYGGAGFAYSFVKLGQRDGSCLVPQWYFGAQGGWNFNQRFSINLDANLSWQGDDLEGFTTQNSTWKMAATIGLSYKFSKIIHFQRIGYDETINNRPIIDAEYGADGDNLQSLIERGDGKTGIHVLSGDMIQAAFFQIDRIELQHTYVLNLGFYAQVIKSNPDKKFLVKGFADIEVGSIKRNLWLSEQRAKVVADVLVKTYGVNPDQLIVGGGDLDYDIPFLREHGHHRFNRCTIVCPLDEDYKIIKENTFEDKSELMDGRVAPPAKNY